MSQPCPPDSAPPTDPLGSRRDIHLTGLTGSLTLVLILVLQDTVWQHSSAPPDLVYLVSPTVSYLVSVITGRLTRRRLLRAAVPPPAAESVPEAGEGPETPSAPA